MCVFPRYPNKPLWLKNKIKSVKEEATLSCLRVFKPTLYSCADPENFVRGGPTLTTFFLWLLLLLLFRKLMRDERIKVIIGPPAKRYLNGVSLACWWWPNIECWLGSIAIFQGIWIWMLRTLYFCDFSGGLGPPVSPLDPHMVFNNQLWVYVVESRKSFIRIVRYLWKCNIV